MLHQDAIKPTFPQSHVITPLYHSEGCLCLVCLCLDLLLSCSPLSRRRVLSSSGLTLPKTNALSHFPCVKWTNIRTPVPHNKLIRERQTPTQQHQKLEGFVCVPRGEGNILSSSHAPTQRLKCIFKQFNGSPCLLVLILQSLCFNRCFAQSGWCLSTSTAPWRLHF